jgi:D-amino-acid dehydrogenase
MGAQSIKGDTVLILGGGIVGVALAYYLAERGFGVTVVDEQPEVGLGASRANGGLISPGFSEPWSLPGLPLKLLGWMGKEDSPFLVRPSALPGLAGWGLRFLGNCREGRWRRAFLLNMLFSLYSRQQLDRVAATTGIEFDRLRNGSMKLFSDKAELDHTAHEAGLLAEHGLVYEVLDPAKCIERVPALEAYVGDYAGAVYFPDDQCCDSHMLTRELARVGGGMGVEFRLGTKVTGIVAKGRRIERVTTDGGDLDADHYVVSLGAASGRVVKPLSITLPIYPVKGYSVTFSASHWEDKPKLPVIDEGRRIGMGPLGDRVRIAGFAEFTGFDSTVTPERCDALVRIIGSLFPALGEEHVIDRWTGLRPVTPDGQPVLGRGPYENLHFNTGHGPLGVNMACGSAAAVAAVIAGEEPEINIEPYAVQRF